MSGQNTQALPANPIGDFGASSAPSAYAGPRSDLDELITVLASSAPNFTGEQFVPGAGVEIAYEHYLRYAFAMQFVSPNSTVLDLGCGVGYGSLLLAMRAKQVFALDRNHQCLQSLTQTIEQVNIDNVTCIEADITHLAEVAALKNAVIDVVVCHEFIEHIPLELQRQICRMISAGAAPFHKNTVFLVSTPERWQYEATRALPNEFHEHELSREDFIDLISGAFKNSQFYWQSAATANCMFPLRIDEKTSAPGPALEPANAEAGSAGAYYFKWLDPNRLTGSIAKIAPNVGLFLYAVATNGPAPIGPKQFVLLDTKERGIQERLSIAAKELRALQARFDQANAELNRAPLAPADVEREHEKALQQIIDSQAAKIQQLLATAEQLGAELQTARRALKHLDVVSPDPEQAAIELLGWRELGQRRLGPHVPAASEAIDVLWSYHRALSSPGHRLVNSFSRRFGSTWLFRKARSAVQFLDALRQA